MVAGGAAARPAPVAHRGWPRPGGPAARALRRAHPRGGAGGGHRGAASPGSTRCSGRWRRRAGSGGATSWPAWAPPSSPCPGRSTACGRPARRPRAGDGEPLGRWCWRPPIRPSPTARPAVAPDRRPPGPGRGRAGGAGRGRAGGVRRAGRRSLWTFPAAADHPDWPAALAARVEEGRGARTRSRRWTASRSARAPWAESAAAGFADGYRGLVVGERESLTPQQRAPTSARALGSPSPAPPTPTPYQLFAVRLRPRIRRSFLVPPTVSGAMHSEHGIILRRPLHLTSGRTAHIRKNPANC